MKKIYYFTLLLLTATGFLNSGLFAQCGAFYDGFETPAMNPAWTIQGSSHTVSMVTTASPVGAQHLQMTGSSGHYQGLVANFPSAQPTNVSWYAKPTQATTHDGYFTVGDANLGTGSNTGMVFSYFQANTGNFRILGSGTPSSIEIPYTVNTWYHVELKNINWTLKNYEVWVNGTSYGTLGFWSTTITSLERVHLYNYSASSTAYYDEIIIGGQNITSSFSVATPLCNGQSTGGALVNAGGGSGPLSYVWSTGDTTSSITNQPAGWYTVDITDSAGCTKTDSVEITEPTAIVSSISTTPVTCPDGTDGTVDLTVSGGTAPYHYLWAAGDTTEDLASAPAGDWTVVVTDTNGCTHEDTATVAGPASFAASLAVTDVGCNGDTNGAIDLNLTGGTAPYTYVWSSGDTTEDLSNLSPGTYTVTATDTMGCTYDDTATVAEPAALAVSGSVTDETSGAANGAIDLTVSGGTPGYTFAWTGPSIFTASTEDISGLEAGEYIVLVTDTNGCNYTDTFTVNNVVGIDPGQGSEGLSVYPNPFQQEFTLFVEGASGEALEYRLLDLTGRVLFADQQSELNGDFTHKFQLADQPAGMYLLEVQLNGTQQVFHVVKR